MLVACKKINVFGRAITPGGAVTAEEEARWRKDPHADSLRACLNQVHVRELSAEEAAQYVLEQRSVVASETIGEEKPVNTFECCGKSFNSERSLKAHVQKAAAHR